MITISDDGTIQLAVVTPTEQPTETEKASEDEPDKDVDETPSASDIPASIDGQVEDTEKNSLPVLVFIAIGAAVLIAFFVPMLKKKRASGTELDAHDNEGGAE